MKLQNMKRSEDTEQIQVFNWAAANEKYYPELKWLYHVPNGGMRNRSEAVKLKAMGVKAGVSDICLPYPYGVYNSLYLEMKYGTNRTTAEQNEFLKEMQKAGSFVAVCYSARAAIKVIEGYLGLCIGTTEKHELTENRLKEQQLDVTYKNGVPHIKEAF